ncbi:hypothetical protein RSAG8_07279, partial [Rhizoctonia solani AG-8 WAC10335]
MAVKTQPHLLSAVRKLTHSNHLSALWVGG